MYIDRDGYFGRISLHGISKVEDSLSFEDADTGKSGETGVEQKVKILAVSVCCDSYRRLEGFCELLNVQKINLGFVVSTRTYHDI